MEQKMPKVLISDKLSNQAKKIFKRYGIEVTINTELSSNNLNNIIKDYDGLAIRSNTKVTKQVINNAKNLKITGEETFDFIDLESNLKPKKIIRCFVTSKNKQKKVIKLKIRIDSKKELEYLINGGILPYVLKQICSEQNAQNYDNL